MPFGADYGFPVSGDILLSATGTTQATATVLVKQVNVFSTVVSGGCAVLPSSYSSGAKIWVLNRSTNSLSIYPSKGDQIEENGIDVAITIEPGSSIEFVSFDSPVAGAPRTWWLNGYAPSPGTWDAQVATIPAAVGSVAALRARTTTTLIQDQCYLLGYAALSDGGEGSFAYEASDTTSSDNGGTIIVDASGRRWHRQIEGNQLDLRAFGIFGQNAASDTLAYNAALEDAASKYTLVHPAGVTVTINAPLQLPSGTTFVINGTIFKAAVTNGANQFDMLQIRGSNITIEGSGVIDGNLANQVTTVVPSAGIGTWYRQYVTGGAWPYNGTTSTDYSACYNNIHIRGLTIQNTVNWAVSISAQYSIVSDCTFINSHNSPQFINSLCCHFHNCVAIGTQDDGLGLYGGNSYCSVTSCRVSNSQTGPFILSDPANGGISDQPNIGCQLVNNICHDCTNAGIFVDGGSGITYATVVATDCLVAGNLAYNCSSPIDIGNVTNLRVSNNVMQQATSAEGSAVANLYGRLSYVVLSDNSIWAQANNACIGVGGDNAANVALVISHNKLFNPGASASSYGVQLQCVGSSAYVTVADNEVFGNINVLISDTSATPAAIFRGTTTPNNLTDIYNFNQNLTIRPIGATTGGIILAPSGDANFAGIGNFGAGVIISSGNLQVTSGGIVLSNGSTASLGNVTASGATKLGSALGFFGASPIAKGTVTGSKGSNAALASLLSVLAGYGLLTDSSS